MQLWAVFQSSVKLLLRRKAPAALIVLLALAGPVSSYYLFSADGTLAGVLRMMITYNYYLVSGMLMLLVCYLSTTVLDTELVEDQMTLLASKPIARWRILLGKWFAVAAITGAALALSGVAGYVLLQKRCSLQKVTQLRRNNPQTLNLSEPQRLEDARAQIEQTRQELLVSRVPFHPQLPLVEDEVQGILANLRASGLTPDKMPPEREVRQAVMLQRKKQALAIPYGTAREFEFNGLPQTKEPVTVRYTLNGTTNPGELGWLHVRWAFSNFQGVAPFYHQTDSRSGTTREFRIPGDLIPADGRLLAGIANDLPLRSRGEPQNVELPLNNGFTLMIPQGPFGANYFRGLLLLWVRILALAAIGIAATTFLSGSVSAFLLISFLIFGASNSFVHDTISSSAMQMSPGGDFFQFVMLALLEVLPDFQLTSPVGWLTSGTEIGWETLSWRVWYDLILRSGLFFVIGIFAFRRRELGVPRIFR